MQNKLSSTSQKSLYRDVLRIRKIEEAIATEYPKQEMRCPVHLSIGQEAPAVAIAHALTHDDYMMGSHRSHAHYLAKGGSLRGLLCEIYGRRDGCSKGQGGSMHLIDRSVGFIGASSIVAGTLPVSVGAAFSAKLKNEKKISVACIGDSVVEEGVFHESMNFASLHDLRSIFYCENNFYSIFSPLSLRQPNRPLVDLGKAHKVESYSIDSSDLFECSQFLSKLVDDVREKPRPIFLEVLTYRTLEHCGPNHDDHFNYRPAGEKELWAQKDALLKAEKILRANHLWDTEEVRKWESEIANEIAGEFEYAKNCPFPHADDLGKYVYAE